MNILENNFRLKRRDMTFSNVSQWMKTNNCFPNDQIIPLDYIAFMRIFQNLILVVCFATIFILYALICVRVTRRRQLKADRDQHYKELLDRSKRNTLATTSVIGIEAVVTTTPAVPVNKFNEFSPYIKSKKKGLNGTMMSTDLSDPLLNGAAQTTNATTSTTVGSDVKSFSSIHHIINDQETSLVVVAPDTENNKSTQTVKSSIPFIKK